MDKSTKLVSDIFDSYNRGVRDLTNAIIENALDHKDYVESTRIIEIIKKMRDNVGIALTNNSKD